MCFVCSSNVINGVSKYYLDEDTSAIEVYSFNGIEMVLYTTQSHYFDGFGIQNHMSIMELTGYFESFDSYE